MRKYRTLDNLEEDYFRKHPREVDVYLTEIFDEYAKDGDSAALLASLRIIAKRVTLPVGQAHDLPPVR